MIKRILLVIALTATALAPAQAAEKVRIGIAYDTGGIGDQSFNDAAASGLAQAQKVVQVDIDITVTDGSPKNREARIRTLIAKGANPILAIGKDYAPTILKLSLEFPERQFAIMNDGSVDGISVTSLVFGDIQAAYLAGVAAAFSSKKGKVAMIATPSQSELFERGFSAGVSASKKSVKANVKYVSSNVSAATKSALANGADVIFISVPGSVTDAFQEIVKTKSAGLIMLQPDQYLTVTRANRKYLYASVVKRVDRAMREWVIATAKGEQFLDFIDEERGIYGRFYGVTNDGVEITLNQPALAQQRAAINEAALGAGKIFG